MNSPRVALLWSVAERYASLVLSLLTSMIIARLLTPAEIGVYSLCAATVVIAGTVRDFGVSQYIIQEPSLDKAKLRSAFAVAMSTGWAIGLVVFLTRGLLVDYYGDPRISSLLAVLSLNFFLLPFSSPAYAMLTREMAFRKIFLIQCLTTMVLSSASLILAYQGFGPYSIAWASVIGTATQGVIVAVMRPKSSLLWPSFHGSANVFRFGLYRMGSTIVDAVTNNAHEFIIGRQFGFLEVGMFSRAKGLVDMFQTYVTFSISRVVTPKMATEHRADQSLAYTFSRGTAIFTSMAWPFFGFLALTAAEIVRIMFGPQWDQAGHIGSLLAVSMLPTALFAFSGSVMAAMGQVERRLTVSLQCAPIHLVGLAIGASIGLDGMALAWLVTNFATATLFALQLRFLLRTSLRDLFFPSLASVPVAVVTVAAVFAALHLGRSLQIHEFALLLIAAVVAICVWYVCIRLLGHPVHEEVTLAARSLRRRASSSTIVR